MLTAAIRPLSPPDGDALLDLCLARDLAEVGEPNTTHEEIAADLSSPTMTTVGIDRPTGGLAGYAWVEYFDGHETVWGDVVVRREAAPEVAGALLDWLRQQAAAVAPDRKLWVFTDSREDAKIGLLEAAGGRVIRRYYRMLVDFTQTPRPPVPDLGPGVEIRGIDDSEADLRTVHRIVDTAFTDHFGHEATAYDAWHHSVVSGFCPDLSLFWLATVDGEPAAAVYSGTLPNHGHVDTLGTLRQFRGRGLARALLLTTFAEFERRGVTRVTLGVDAANPNALALYESVGMAMHRNGMRYELDPLR
ncbi:MAG: GNAT family N-acetyltransferase [Frankiaceae bacterium]|nr:GNAT family N-acetyltransferase [Frankiaceae bacterium]MBV9871251.1 GNAT family N-acetyltransferase [Frankiaceae bacterium]